MTAEISKENIEKLVKQARKKWKKQQAQAKATGHPKSWDAAEAAQDRLKQLEQTAVELLGCTV